MATSESLDIPSSSEDSQVPSNSTGEDLASSTIEGGVLSDISPMEVAVDWFFSDYGSFSAFAFQSRDSKIVHSTGIHTFALPGGRYHSFSLLQNRDHAFLLQEKQIETGNHNMRKIK